MKKLRENIKKRKIEKGKWNWNLKLGNNKNENWNLKEERGQNYEMKMNLGKSSIKSVVFFG